MELIIKVYNDKPSRIGIKYLQEYSAVRAYEEIYTKNMGDACTLRMEMIRNKLDLSLVSEQNGSRIVYKELEYKIEQLKKLEAFARPGSDLQFVHIFSRSNTLMIAKPFRTQRFVNITAYEIIGTERFTNTL